MMNFLDADAEDVSTFLLPEMAKQSTVTIFYQTRQGPTIIGDDCLPFATKDHRAGLQKLGSFFSVAIGQGSYYNTGCYGPLPALGSDFNCLVHSAIIKDESEFDPRMKGWNYIMICFFFHKSLDGVIAENKSTIEDYLETRVANAHVRDLTESKLAEIKDNLIALIS